MNYKAIVLSVAMAVGGMGTASGQFLKKLGKKVEKAAERTVEQRAERETAKKTDQALDKVFEAGDEKEKKKGDTKQKAARDADGGSEAHNAASAKGQSAWAAMLGGASMEDVPDTYTFSYRATMKVIDENERKEANVLYWLEPGATYFGTEVLADDVTGQVAVMDMALESMVMFMDNGGQKTAMRMGGNRQLMDQLKDKAADDTDDVKITSIESKTVLGYRCKGFQIETDDGISNVWITNEAPVGMVSGMMKGDYIPEGLPDLGPNALFMETDYTSKKGGKTQFRMVCTELKPVSKAIHKKDYQPMTLGAD